MKSEFDELKAENESLKATIAAFESRLSALEKGNDPDSEWKEFYSEYSIKYEKETQYNYTYYNGEELQFMFDDDLEYGVWLIVFCENDGKKHFLEYNPDDGSSRYDKFYNSNAIFCEKYCPPLRVQLNLTQNENKPFYAAYKKP